MNSHGKGGVNSDCFPPLGWLAGRRVESSEIWKEVDGNSAVTAPIVFWVFLWDD